MLNGITKYLAHTFRKQVTCLYYVLRVLGNTQPSSECTLLPFPQIDNVSLSSISYLTTQDENIHISPGAYMMAMSDVNFLRFKESFMFLEKGYFICKFLWFQLLNKKCAFFVCQNYYYYVKIFSWIEFLNYYIHTSYDFPIS